MSSANYGNSDNYPAIQFQDSYFNSFRNENCVSAQQTFNNVCMNESTDIQGPFRIPKRRGRPIANNAARERSRVKTLRSAFLELQRTLPAVPPDTKLSKLDVLVLATTYIAHLMSALQDDGDVSHIFAANGCMHPVKKWPMRTRLYAGILSSTLPQGPESEEPFTPPDMTSYASWPQDSQGI